MAERYRRAMERRSAVSLTEMSTELECINYIVTGIGINVANHEFPEEIRDVATSLYLETGKEVRRSSLSPRSCVRMRDIMINSWKTRTEILDGRL